MVVARLRVQFLVPDCSSLKQKRFVLRSLKDRMRNRFNVAVCESDFQDKWQRCELGIVTVATDRTGAERVARQIADFLEEERRIVVCDCEREFY